MVETWNIGLPPRAGSTDAVVAFTYDEYRQALASSAQVIGFDQAMRGVAQTASVVNIYVPAYRPRTLMPVLSWLASRLAEPGATVSWFLAKQQGPDSLKKLLGELGWDLGKKRVGQLIRLSGTVPAGIQLPAPAHFAAELGQHQSVNLFADYGVFSPARIDEGAVLLLDAAMRQSTVDTVADIGIGYGALALGLVLNKVARSAVATDVDYVALWLAEMNAKALGIALDVVCDEDPLSIPATELTVCNVPTHMNAETSKSLVRSLIQRAQQGKLLTVVHTTSAERYVQYFESSGLSVRRVTGEAHTVLETARQ